MSVGRELCLVRFEVLHIRRVRRSIDFRKLVLNPRSSLQNAAFHPVLIHTS